LPGLRLRLLAETLPWHVRYGSFTGVLPRIGSVKVTLTGPAIRIYELPIGGSCIYRSLLTSPTRHELALGASGEVTSFTAEGSPSPVPFSEGTFICSRELAVASIGTITQLARASALTLTLI